MLTTATTVADDAMKILAEYDVDVKSCHSHEVRHEDGKLVRLDISLNGHHLRSWHIQRHRREDVLDDLRILIAEQRHANALD